MSVSKNLLLAAAAGLLSVSCASSSQSWQPAPFQAGQQRLSLGTNAFTQMTMEDGATGNDVDSDLLALNASYGYFYQPNLEVGGTVGYNDADIGGIESTMWILGGYLRYWIDNRAQLRPYVQGRMGIGNAEVAGMDDDLLEYGFGVGIADFLSQSTSIDLLLEYSDRQFDNSDDQTSGIGLYAFFSVYF